MAEAGSLYETDFVRWSETQAEALRAASALRTNAPLDWENLAEEIESLGKSQRHELRSRTRTLVEHLLKLEYSTAIGPRPGWSRTVRRTRIAIDDLLAESPSLRPILPELLAQVQPSACEFAAELLEEAGEGSAAMQARGRGSYTVAEAFGPWLPSEEPN